MKHWLAAAVASIAAAGVLAQEEEQDTWGMAIELGAVSTTGNTETLSIRAQADIRQDLENWQNEVMANALFKEDEVVRDGQEQTERTAERYFISGKSGFKLNREHSTLFVFASHTDDRFGAFRRYSTASLGYGTRWLDTETMFFDVEIGPGYFRGERALEDETTEVEQGAMLRAALEYQWIITDTTKFAQALSVESGSDNTRTISDTSISTRVSDALQLKVGYSLFHNSRVAPDKESADATTFITLVYDL